MSTANRDIKGISNDNTVAMVASFDDGGPIGCGRMGGCPGISMNGELDCPLDGDDGPNKSIAFILRMDDTGLGSICAELVVTFSLGVDSTSLLSVALTIPSFGCET